MTAVLSEREREKARLARFRDIGDRLAGDVWTMEADAGVTRVFSTRPSGETVCIATIHADALPAEYEVLCSGADMLAFFLVLQDRAAAKVRELTGQLGQNDRAAKAKDFSAQAAMLCQSGSFRAFLSTKGGPVVDAQAADTRMKSLLSITSKKQINDDPAAQARFKSLRGDYDLWMKGGLSASLGRLFDEVTIPYGDQTTKAMKIVCASCDAPAYFPHERGPSRKPPVAAQQHFQNKGWQVGSVPKKDVCPDCLRKRKRKDFPMATPKTTAGAEPPREMTRDDRRIIFDKLDQVYANPETGYRAPWTDAAVAKDLGIPVAWVSEVRDQFYGPAGSNPLFDDYLARREALKVEFSELSALQKTIADRYVTFCTKIDEMDRIGKRIEREIGR